MPMGGDAMAHDTTYMIEEELDAEDELDGWGPVRVRRSTLPAAPTLAASPPAEDATSARNTLQGTREPVMT
jgi:hypothetical protein